MVVIAAWQLLASQGWVNRVYTSQSSTIVSAAWHYLPSAQGLADLGTSLEELAVGFALSVTVGVTFGLLMGRYRLFEETTSLGLNIFYSLPLIALAPIIVLWFGIGIASKIVVVFLASLFPILVSTLTGVKNVDPTIRDMARSYRAKERQMWLTILLPASVPSILSGIRIGMPVVPGDAGCLQLPHLLVADLLAGGVAEAAEGDPPGLQRGDGERGRVVVVADVHESLVLPQVVHAVGDGLPLGPAREVVVQDAGRRHFHRVIRMLVSRAGAGGRSGRCR